jgi:hypothetical protein
MKAVRLLQGYIWHPKTEAIDLADFLPTSLEPDIHILWDRLPRAPFTFFDDGTLSSTQQVYQFTVLQRSEDEMDVAGLVPWVAEVLQKKLESTPAWVGWQIFEDLRNL